MEERAPTYCIPADGVRCRGCRWDEETGCCYRPDCDALFTPRALRQQQREWVRDPRPQLIVAAGPERSGSTWLYSAVRLLFHHARKPLDAYWLKRVTDAALDARGAGCPGAPHVLVKTHAWSEAWDLRRATHVFVTHRDLRQARGGSVLASYRRVGWAHDLPFGYVEDHMRWKDVAEVDIAFEDIVARPEALLEDLATRMGLHGLVDYHQVQREIAALPVPTRCVDPVTQLWPEHCSRPGVRARLDEATTRRLVQQHPSFFELYDYT
eukprot:scaffold3.g6453.t1